MKKTTTKTKKKSNVKLKLEKRQIFLIVLLLVLVAGTCFAFTYTWMLMSKTKEENRELALGNLYLSLDNTEGTAIVIDDAYPMTDVGGLTQAPYTFTLQNNGDFDINYAIVLEEDEEAINECKAENEGVCNTVPLEDLKYSITRNGVMHDIAYLKDNHNILDMGQVLPNEKNKVTYSLKIWVDYDTETELENAKFFGKLALQVQTAK